MCCIFLKIKIFVYGIVKVVMETTEFHRSSFSKATSGGTSGCTFVIGKLHFLLLHIYLAHGIKIFKKKGKGKAIPLQAWTGPEGSRKLRFPDFVTTAQDCGRLSALRTGRFLPPGNTPGTHFC